MKEESWIEKPANEYVEHKIGKLRDSGDFLFLSEPDRERLTPILKEALKDSFQAGGAIALLEILSKQFERKNTL